MFHELPKGAGDAKHASTGVGATLGARGVCGADVAPHVFLLPCPASTRRALWIAYSASPSCLSPGFGEPLDSPPGHA